MLRGIRIDCMGICTELKGNWREELLGNSCGSSANACGITWELVGTSWEIMGNSCGSRANSCGITGELAGSSWEIIGEFVWK